MDDIKVADLRKIIAERVAGRDLSGVGNPQEILEATKKIREGVQALGIVTGNVASHAASWEAISESFGINVIEIGEALTNEQREAWAQSLRKAAATIRRLAAQVETIPTEDAPTG